ncbi:TerD family protein [Streptomyces zagrosensis]|uniref:Tellurium resistance protein TerD n=1 Tax=Streptomyces zagrosensis TaxID=1042984 RepID=A0A7W9QAE3_9ACTN|nr:TerD family protein [Streptomyces zagrosensis]MBB5936580.1 tellurium resistance protein TerD [Streptomyces zagrosensis]
MSSLNKGLKKVEVALKWDPSPAGEPVNDLDIIAATYSADAPYGKPGYLVHFGSRSPDGTITLNRDSQTGQGFGMDEVMTLELDRLADSYVRVVVGVVIQQGGGRKTFGEVESTLIQIQERYTTLVHNDFSGVPEATAATIAEIFRDESGEWELREIVQGFDTEPVGFAELMGQRIP